VAGAYRIANARQHVCDRIGQPHRLLLLRRPFASAIDTLRRRTRNDVLSSPDSGAQTRVPLLRILSARVGNSSPIPYQDDFDTPGISPRKAKPRKHSRQIPNLRK